MKRSVYKVQTPINRKGGALEGVLSEVGWVQDVIVNRTTGHLIDGHLRCQVAARNGEKTIPVVDVDLQTENAITATNAAMLAESTAGNTAEHITRRRYQKL